MKLSEMIDLMTAMKSTYGDLDVLENDFFSVRSVIPETITAQQAKDWDMPEGQMFARVVANW